MASEGKQCTLEIYFQATKNARKLDNLRRLHEETMGGGGGRKKIGGARREEEVGIQDQSPHPLLISYLSPSRCESCKRCLGTIISRNPGDSRVVCCD